MTSNPIMKKKQEDLMYDLIEWLINGHEFYARFVQIFRVNADPLQTKKLLAISIFFYIFD